MSHSLSAGVSLKPQYVTPALAARAAGLWFEFHPENYMVAGGARLAGLFAVAERWPLSMHGVGLSLAADEAPDQDHLAALRRLAAQVGPKLVSEHLAWSKRDGAYAPDLLPFPRTTAMLVRIADNICRAQDALDRPILVENPAHYLHLAAHEWDEPDFLAELVRRTGCGLLVDVNNVFVSARNLGGSAESYLDALSPAAIGEIHLAGHTLDRRVPGGLLIDTHDAPVAEPVWRLYERLISRIGSRPTLIERDDNLPDFAELMAERGRAHAILTGQTADA